MKHKIQPGDFIVGMIPVNYYDDMIALQWHGEVGELSSTEEFIGSLIVGVFHIGLLSYYTIMLPGGKCATFDNDDEDRFIFTPK